MYVRITIKGKDIIGLGLQFSGVARTFPGGREGQSEEENDEGKLG